MKRTLLFLLVIAFTTSAVVLAYQIGYRQKSYETVEAATPKLKDATNQFSGVFSCPYEIDGSIFKEYVKSAVEAEVTGKPEFIKNPEIIKTSKPFDAKEFEKRLYKVDSKDKGWDSKEADVNADGKKEIIISANLAMNHTPNQAIIVDKGNIVFTTTGANVWIKEVYGGQGFILNETVDWNTGEVKQTRYVYKDGGFLPLWEQRICWVRFI